MNRIKWLPIIFVFIVFANSCSSPMKGRKFPVGKPHFEGIVTPISIPIQPEYKPAGGKFKIDTFLSVNREKGLERTEIGMNGNYNISRLGDLLVWDAKITKMNVDNKTIAPTLPIIDSRLLTDKFGTTKEFEMSFPAFDNAKIDEKERNRISEELKKEIKKFSRSLPQTPIRSGDVLICVLKRSEVQELIRGIGSAENITTQNVIVYDFEDINLVLEGWSYYKNRKVAVGSVDYSLSIDIPGSELLISLEYSGYFLFDSATFQTLEAKFRIEAEIFEVSSKKFVESKVVAHLFVEPEGQSEGDEN